MIWSVEVHGAIGREAFILASLISWHALLVDSKVQGHWIIPTPVQHSIPVWPPGWFSRCQQKPSNSEPQQELEIDCLIVSRCLTQHALILTRHMFDVRFHSNIRNKLRYSHWRDHVFVRSKHKQDAAAHANKTTKHVGLLSDSAHAKLQTIEDCFGLRTDNKAKWGESRQYLPFFLARRHFNLRFVPFEHNQFTATL